MANEAETVRDLAVKAAGAAHIVKSNSGREYLVTPQGFEFEDVSEDHALEVNKPKLIEQGVTLQNADALVEYVNRFKGDTSLLFANVDTSTITAAVDYHGKDKPELVRHRATLALAFSEEWKTWTAVNGTLQPQLEFARFIEENSPDIKAPDAASLLEAVRDLQAKRSVNFTAVVRTASDNENFEYSDATETRGKGGIEVPTRFLLNIPVYFGEPPGEVSAFLRWRLEEAKLKLGIKLHRAEHIRQAAFRAIVTAVHERTGVLPVYGYMDGGK